MKITFWTYLIYVSFLLASCKNDFKSSFAIRDFSKSLQPYLTGIVSNGVVGFDTLTKFVENYASDEELKKLSKCEHPVLRAVAFRTMLERPTFNHFDVIMGNLDDTAVVARDAGEWGIRYVKISDDILQHGRWKDTTSKNKTIETIILNHRYLSSAYYKILTVEPKDSYYSSIKEMAQHVPNYDNIVGQIGFNEIERALYALAKFGKSEDIQIIKKALISNLAEASTLTFEIMGEYPDETYLEVFEDYYPRRFYREICRGKDTDKAISFINSIAKYKNERSAKILREILKRNPFMPCSADTNYLKESLVYAIWNNPCQHYSELRRSVADIVTDYENSKLPGIPLDPQNFPPDTSAEPIRWW